VKTLFSENQSRKPSYDFLLLKERFLRGEDEEDEERESKY